MHQKLFGKSSIEKKNLKPHFLIPYTTIVPIEITLGTLIDQLFTRSTTIVTFRVVFSFLNENKWVWVTLKCVSNSKQAIWVFPKNTIGMSRITAICTVVEPML